MVFLLVLSTFNFLAGGVEVYATFHFNDGSGGELSFSSSIAPISFSFPRVLSFLMLMKRNDSIEHCLVVETT